ncbi:hypothetical protein GW796_05720 [archaeon]|nr:hypothetical protein [archaeon]NCQ51382.1 hypothetical protein [archaeon]NCT58792.1 hypothetical protein [archaeon]
MSTSLGFVYVAKRKCGKISASAWDDVNWNNHDKIKTFRSWLARGDTIEVIERFKNDEMPEWICDTFCCEGCCTK